MASLSNLVTDESYSSPSAYGVARDVGQQWVRQQEQEWMREQAAKRPGGADPATVWLCGSGGAQELLQALGAQAATRPPRGPPRPMLRAKQQLLNCTVQTSTMHS